MIIKILCLVLFILISKKAQCGLVEQRTQTAVDGFLNSQFIYNPSLLSSNKAGTSIIALKDTKNASVIGSPNNNRQEISYDYKNDILGLASLFPFGGGAAGLSYLQINNELNTDNSSSSRVIKETKRDDIYAFRFIIELTPSLDFGFHYEYKQAANYLYGGFFIDDEDKTSYKAFLSGYRLGLNYHNPSLGLSLYTAPPLRGKALVDGEQKIVTEKGSGGAEVRYKYSQSLKLGLGLTRWFYKKDDRLELSTSPVDARNISLNGVDLDQYLAPIQNIMMSFYVPIKQNSYFLLSLFQQESVFHFDEDSLPGDDRENLPSFRYLGAKAMFVMEKNKYHFKISLRSTYPREQDTITDDTRKLGHRNYADYNAKETTVILSLGFNNY